MQIFLLWWRNWLKKGGKEGREVRKGGRRRLREKQQQQHLLSNS